MLVRVGRASSFLSGYGEEVVVACHSPWVSWVIGCRVTWYCHVVIVVGVCTGWGPSNDGCWRCSLLVGPASRVNNGDGEVTYIAHLDLGDNMRRHRLDDVARPLTCQVIIVRRLDW